jgi:hypothetical protein
MPNRTSALRAKQDLLHSQDGMALLVAVMMMLMISAISVAAIDHSGSESVTSGRSRAATESFYAADAGIQATINRLGGGTPIDAPFAFDLTPEINVRSGPMSAGTAEAITYMGAGEPPEGYSLEVGAGFVNRQYLAIVTGTAHGDAITELEAKMLRLDSSGGAY